MRQSTADGPDNKMTSSKVIYVQPIEFTDETKKIMLVWCLLWKGYHQSSLI